MKASDIVDRWSILRMKGRLCRELLPELDMHSTIVKSMLIEAIDMDVADDVLAAIFDLVETNAKIWLLEASIRDCLPNDPANSVDLTLAEVGHRALLIRDLNDRRVSARVVIDGAFGNTPERKAWSET